MQVKDVMTSPAVTVQTGTSLKDVAGLLAERGISGLPVLDADGTLVGVVSEADILRKELAGPARTAGEAMTSPARTIEPVRAAVEAARLMLEAGVNRLPVVSGGELVGIVTRADLVRAFVRPDADIEQDIRENVALRSHGIDPNGLGVLVREGVVQISGPVASSEDAELVERLIRGIAGVVSVDARLDAGARALSRG